MQCLDVDKYATIDARFACVEVRSLAPVRLLAKPSSEYSSTLPCARPPVSFTKPSSERCCERHSHSSSTHRSRSAGADATSRERAACNAVGYGTWAYLGPHESGRGTWHDRFSCAAAAALHASLHAEEHRCCFGFGWDVPQALKKQVEAWRNGLADDYAKMKKLAPWVDGQSVAYSQGLCLARGSADCLRACRCMGAYQEGAGGKSPARPEETEGAALLGSAAPSVFWCSEYA